MEEAAGVDGEASQRGRADDDTLARTLAPLLLFARARGSPIKRPLMAGDDARPAWCTFQSTPRPAY